MVSEVERKADDYAVKCLKGRGELTDNGDMRFPTREHARQFEACMTEEVGKDICDITKDAKERAVLIDVVSFIIGNKSVISAETVTIHSKALKRELQKSIGL